MNGKVLLYVFKTYDIKSFIFVFTIQNVSFQHDLDIDQTSVFHSNI